MRLTADQARTIVQATHAIAGPSSRVRLFGSRVRDDRTGGDIDLLVECTQPVAQPIWLAAQLTARLQRHLGDRRIDVLVIDPSTPREPIHAIALRDGIELKA